MEKDFSIVHSLYILGYNYSAELKSYVEICTLLKEFEEACLLQLQELRVSSQFFSYRWNPRNVIHLAAMFKDIEMSAAELKFVIEKILRSFKDIDLQDLPALVYQLLLLSTKVMKSV